MWTWSSTHWNRSIINTSICLLCKLSCCGSIQLHPSICLAALSIRATPLHQSPSLKIQVAALHAAVCLGGGGCGSDVDLQASRWISRTRLSSEPTDQSDAAERPPRFPSSLQLLSLLSLKAVVWRSTWKQSCWAAAHLNAPDETNDIKKEHRPLWNVYFILECFNSSHHLLSFENVILD